MIISIINVSDTNNSKHTTRATTAITQWALSESKELPRRNSVADCRKPATWPRAGGPIETSTVPKGEPTAYEPITRQSQVRILSPPLVSRWSEIWRPASLPIKPRSTPRAFFVETPVVATSCDLAGVSEVVSAKSRATSAGGESASDSVARRRKGSVVSCSEAVWVNRPFGLLLRAENPRFGPL